MGETMEQRAGQLPRTRAPRRRRDVSRRHGSTTFVATLVWFAIVALVAWFFSIFLGRDGAVFAIGVGVGAFGALTLSPWQLIDDLGARLVRSLDSEPSTESELRRLKRAGWRTISNIQFGGGEIDHVAVGPGGVVVIESQSSAADWDDLFRTGVATQYAERAHTGVIRVKSLIGQHSDRSVEPLSIVVTWASGHPGHPIEFPGGVRSVAGDQLREVLDALPEVLSHDDVVVIAQAVNRARLEFDEAAGVRNPGRLRRLLGIGTVG